MDNSYFYLILRFRGLSEGSSSRSIRSISGDNEFYSIYQNGKGYVHMFSYLDCLLYARATLYARVLCKPTYSVMLVTGAEYFLVYFSTRSEY